MRSAYLKHFTKALYSIQYSISVRSAQFTADSFLCVNSYLHSYAATGAAPSRTWRRRSSSIWCGRRSYRARASWCAARPPHDSARSAYATFTHLLRPKSQSLTFPSPLLFSLLLSPHEMLLCACSLSCELVSCVAARCRSSASGSTRRTSSLSAKLLSPCRGHLLNRFVVPHVSLTHKLKAHPSIDCTVVWKQSSVAGDFYLFFSSCP